MLKRRKTPSCLLVYDTGTKGHYVLHLVRPWHLRPSSLHTFLFFFLPYLHNCILAVFPSWEGEGDFLPDVMKSKTWCNTRANHNARSYIPFKWTWKVLNMKVTFDSFVIDMCGTQRRAQSLVSMKHFLIGDELLPSASEGHSRAGLFGDINKKQRWVYYRTLREGDTLMKLDFCDTRRTTDLLCSDARLKTLHIYWNLAGWIILLSWSVALHRLLSCLSGSLQC